MNRKISVNLALAIAIIAMSVTFSVTMILSQNIFDKTVSGVREKELMYDKLAEIDKTVRRDYYGDINQDTLFDMLGAGYLQGISDNGARYYTAKKYVEYLSEQSGKTVSIGVEIVKEANSYPRVIRVYTGSPAEEAGIQKNYRLVKVGDTDLKSLTTEQINAALRGEQGTSIVLTVQDYAEKELPAMELQRRQYDTPSVDINRRQGTGIGYLKINTFNAGTAGEVRKAVDTLKNDEQGLSALVIDLRNNTGGALEYAVDVIDLLAPAGPIGTKVDKKGGKILVGTSDLNAVGVPIAVLVNKGTAAGAELLATSVRDFNLGKIVGVTTAGKGTIQCPPVRLSDGSAISYTVGALLTKAGDSFEGVGVTPDVESMLKPEEERTFYDLMFETDSQIAKAVEVAQTLANLQPVYDAGTAPESVAPAPSSQAQSEAASTDAASKPAA